MNTYMYVSTMNTLTMNTMCGVYDVRIYLVLTYTNEQAIA